MATDPLQSLIRSLPTCFDGQGAADFTASIAKQVRDQAPSLDNFWTRPIDWGEGTKIYSVDKIINSANALELYGQELRDKGGKYCNASYEKNKLITMLGDVYGLIGARIGVNAVLKDASEGLIYEIIDETKTVFHGLADYSKWLIVGAVAVFGIILLMKYGGK